MNFPLDVQREINRARAKHAPLHSLHEGYAVLLEEVDELWERVKMQNTDHEGDTPTYRELVQIGAMAQRIAEDVIRPNKEVSIFATAQCSPPCSAFPAVLDMCCGPRMMWFDKHDPRAVFIDKRRERHAMNRPKRGTVEWTETDPDQIADFTALPFHDETFWHVVFDPPHFERSGKIGYLAMKYGWLDGDWRKMLAAGFAEGFRVLRPGGTLVFKWTATENPVAEILKLTPMKPLYGHKSGKQAQTHWIAFLKPNAPRQPEPASGDRLDADVRRSGVA